MKGIGPLAAGSGQLTADSMLKSDCWINCQLLAAGCLLTSALCLLVFEEILVILLLAQMFFHQSREEIHQIFNL